MEQEDFEIWIYLFDEPGQVRCIQGEIEVVIQLEPLQILAYSPGSLPSGRPLNRALKIVRENREMLLQKWEEYGSA